MPRDGCLEDGENDLGELNIKRRRVKANSREELTSIVKLPKVYRGSQSHGIGKKITALYNILRLHTMYMRR
jgi:hypothetical protein